MTRLSRLANFGGTVTEFFFCLIVSDRFCIGLLSPFLARKVISRYRAEGKRGRKVCHLSQWRVYVKQIALRWAERGRSSPVVRKLEREELPQQSADDGVDLVRPRRSLSQSGKTQRLPADI